MAVRVRSHLSSHLDMKTFCSHRLLTPSVHTSRGLYALLAAEPVLTARRSMVATSLAPPASPRVSSGEDGVVRPGEQEMEERVERRRNARKGGATHEKAESRRAGGSGHVTGGRYSPREVLWFVSRDWLLRADARLQR